MFKKFLVVTLLVVFLTGCEATYDLDVSDGFLESTTAIPTTADDLYMILNYSTNIPAFTTDSFDPEDDDVYEDVEYYNYSYINNESLNLNYKYNDKYKLSTIAKQTLPNLTVSSDKTVRIHASGDLNCFKQYDALEKVTINIKVPYEIVYQNADYVNNDVYTWVVTKDDLSTTIDIEYNNPEYKGKENPVDPNNNDDPNNKNDEPKNDSKSKKSKKADNTYVLLLSGLFFIALFGIIIFVNKFKKTN